VTDHKSIQIHTHSVPVRWSLCAALAIGTLYFGTSGAQAGRSPRRGDGAIVWAGAPTTVNAVAAAPAVTSPAQVVTAFSLLLVAVVVRIVSVQRSQRVGLSRFGGLYGP
jgi:hypothetical protein